MKNGFVALKAFLFFFILVVLIFGGYTGYQYFTNPSFNLYGLLEEPLIPSSLAAQAPGANADSIILYRSDEDLISAFDDILQQLEVTDAPVEPADVVSAVILLKGPNEAEDFEGAAIVAIEFSDAQKASFVAGQMSALSAFVPIETKIEDAILVVRLNADVFEGSVNDNPLLAKVDPEYKDSEIIMLTDVTALSDMNMVTYSLMNSFSSASYESHTSSLIPVAHAQLISPMDQPGRLVEASYSDPDPMIGLTTSMNSLLNFTKFQALYVRVNEDVGEMNLVLEFAEKSEIPALLENMSSGMDLSSGDMDELEEGYDKALESLDEMIALAREEVKSPEYDYGNVTIERTGMILTVHASGDLKELQNLPAVKDTQESPMRARDAARKADINTIVAALETYNADEGEFPPESQCLDDLEPLLGSYFPSGIPEDPSGKTFRTYDEPCLSGYFYTSYGEHGYVVWAQMEMSENGNSHFVLPPDTVKEKEDGTHYGLVHADFEAYLESRSDFIDSLSSSSEDGSTQETLTVPATVIPEEPTSTQETPKKTGVKRSAN